MCLRFAVERPDTVLATGEHAGHQWAIVHNNMGYRCGYIRVDKGHPWYGKGLNDINANVHGGITFAEADVPCDKGGNDDGWWIGFDCAHSGDEPDPDLPNKRDFAHHMLASFYNALTDSCSQPRTVGEGVRTQKYVEAECCSLCEQAQAAAS